MGELSDVVFPFTSICSRNYLGKSDPADYILHYLADLDAETCVIEDNYIDKDFMIDFQLFYCRSFENIDKTTKRIHFFSKKFSADFLEECLYNNTKFSNDELNKSYLGFIVVKPIKNMDRAPIIGRTLLKTYPIRDGRHFVTGSYSASLFGIELKIRSLPFQMQDMGVSVCAAVALWTALHPLKDVFDTARHSPAEITDKSSSSPNKDRKFPSTGLTIEQIINYIRLIGLDVETLSPGEELDINIFLKTFINAGLPVIAALYINNKSRKKKKFHAAVISGYKMDNSQAIKELYVHDDRVGPFCRVNPDGSFYSWNYELSNGGNEITIDKLLVPIYPKIRTPFMYMDIYYRNIRNKAQIEFEQDNNYRTELYLISNRDYKNFLLNKSVKNKVRLLCMSLPRHMWIIRVFYRCHPFKDYVFDATSVFPRKLITVSFEKAPI